MKSDHSRFKRKWGERKWRKLLRNFFVKEGGKIVREKITLIKVGFCFCFFFLKMGETKLACFPVGMTQ